MQSASSRWRPSIARGERKSKLGAWSKGSYRLDSATFSFEASANGTLQWPFGSLSLKDVELREKGFQLEHHCSMQASLFYEGFLQGALVKLWVTTWLGLARVDLVLSIGAAKVTQFPEGVVLVIKADGLREIQQSETRGALGPAKATCRIQGF
jgi:hypothetical protein